MTITVLVPHDDGVTALSAVPGVRAVRYDVEDLAEGVPGAAAEAEVLIPGAKPAALLPLLGVMPRLRLIQLLSAGAEDWADEVPDGVLLSTCRGAHGGSTAEWVVAVLLSAYRGLPVFAEAQRERVWRPGTTGTLQGSRVLVVGAGDVGNQVRRRLLPFDAWVTMVGFTPRDGVHGAEELPRLLPGADAVVLVTPLTSRTRGMVDAEFLAALPDGALLVNASRGPVVDTGALLAELTSGRLSAALDVTDPEPLPPGHPLWTAPNVVITPHVAGAVRGARRRSYRVAAAEIERYVRGELPDNLVQGEY
ncbi:2-hydroxyacid dehydrogenase [Saccharomonospora xinjiangensis]|uniref:Phosphoglycerate dehydrogenase-like oxidoreductase n=1 Tax=Saccharomonospora xinjiangensis XJ-54 TaxID=882086 RepID=I0UZQ1_9PSEU|nr:2-hydroxyacid dehydrogenase [Saccharomonospora xinjiangensis]EID53354.1 phosphoglycerate dehydrogenase-like oxidoreductase [Saccharomonospora xinjiangensis XJ-54]